MLAERDARQGLTMRPADILAVRGKPLRSAALVASALLIVMIALAELSGLNRGRSLGYLYLLPMLITAPHLNRAQILGLAALCALLREALGPLAWGEGLLVRSIYGLVAFGGAGLFVSELAERRRRRARAEAQAGGAGYAQAGCGAAVARAY